MQLIAFLDQRGTWYLPIVCAAAAFLLSLAMTPTYVAEVTILPSGETPSLGMLGQLAAASGIQLGGDGNLEEHYGRIAVSNSVLDSVLAVRWEFEGQRRTLREILRPDAEADGDSSREFKRFRNYVRHDIVSFRRDKTSGFMVLAVAMPEYPELAAEVANRIAGELGDRVERTRRFRASEQRRFVAERLFAVRQELSEAESDLVAFEAQNRAYASSPDLNLQWIRRDREVRALTGVWTDLRRQLELLRIDESKDVGVVQILDRAEAPVTRSSPKRLLITAVGFIFGCVVAGFLAIARSAVAPASEPSGR